MSRMKHVVWMCLMCLSVGVSAQTAEEPEYDVMGESEQFQMPEEEITDDRKWWKEQDNEYYRSPDFKLQIGRTQLAIGSLMVPGGLIMVGTGAAKMNRSEGKPVTYEGVTSDEGDHKRGRGLLIAGTLTGVTGVFLVFKGHDTLAQWKNEHGETTTQLKLTSSGLALKF